MGWHTQAAGMDISRRNAMQIVTEISGIINQHVNMMNAEGIIIASTTPRRIGDFHAAASRIVAEGLDELIIWDDDEYQGARKGLNLPILLDDTIVGVIGVTGEYTDVVKYGQIIKKMTEILLLENFRQKQKKIDDRIRARFLDAWLFEDAQAYSRVLVEQGKLHGIDINLPRRVLVAEIADLHSFCDSTEGQQIIDGANKIVRLQMEPDNRSVFTKTAGQMVCLVADCDDARMRSIAEQLTQRVKDALAVTLRIGIDERTPRLNHAYQKARKALNTCKRAQKSICLYSDTTLDIFMDEISRGSKDEFFSRIFRQFDPVEIEGWVRLLRAYFRANGSISRAAGDLFIHKNTLQCRLNRLRDQTGYDPRNLQDAALFYLAIQFYREDDGKQT